MNSKKRTFLVTMAALATALSASSALAQQSRDTLRIGVLEQLKGLSTFHFPGREQGFFERQIHDRLIAFNETTGKFMPSLAKSWKVVNPTTYEFELRDNVRFHNGNKFTAHDLAYMVGWITDPKSRFARKGGWLYLRDAEAIGDYKVRIRTKRPTAWALLKFNYMGGMNLDSKVHRSLKNKGDYGRNPIGTGPYRVAKFDNYAGIIIERNPDYTGPSRRKARIKRIHGMALPERQTQIAHLLAGNLDIIRDINNHELENLGKMKRFEVYIGGESVDQIYFMMDAAGRTGRTELKDIRVRKAIWMAIDRKSIVKHHTIGGGKARVLNDLCHKVYPACADTKVKPPAHDPVAAKKLMVEAGYGDGFSMTLVARPKTRDAAIAISGDLAKIGIKISVSTLPAVAYRKLRRTGKVEMVIAEYPNAQLPDPRTNMYQYFGNKAWDYAQDPVLRKANRAGSSTMDPNKRRKIYSAGFDHAMSRFYVLPIATLPDSYLYAKRVKVVVNPFHRYRLAASAFRWR